MTPTTSSRTSRLLTAAVYVAAYTWSWWRIFTAGHVSILPVIAGFLAPIVASALFNGWRFAVAWVASFSPR